MFLSQKRILLKQSKICGNEREKKLAASLRNFGEIDEFVQHVESILYTERIKFSNCFAMVMLLFI